MRLHVALAIGIAALPASAFASAWTQPQGKGQVIVTAGYYQANDIYDNHGHDQSAANYHNWTLNPYLEYGLYDDWTLGANLMLERAEQNVTGTPDVHNAGIGDSEFFVRKRLYNKDGLVASVQPSFTLPPPDADKRPPLGSPNGDVGLTGSVGYSMSLFGYQDFVNADAGYRHRFGDQRDQIKFNATLGVGVAPDWMVMPQLFTTFRTSDPNRTSVTQSSADDYQLMRMQLSGVYSVSADTKLQAGAFADVEGKNTGVGRGMLVSVWQNF